MKKNNRSVIISIVLLLIYIPVAQAEGWEVGIALPFAHTVNEDVEAAAINRTSGFRANTNASVDADVSGGYVLSVNYYWDVVAIRLTHAKMTFAESNSRDVTINAALIGVHKTWDDQLQLLAFIGIGAPELEALDTARLTQGLIGNITITEDISNATVVDLLGRYHVNEHLSAELGYQDVRFELDQSLDSSTVSSRGKSKARIAGFKLGLVYRF